MCLQKPIDKIVYKFEFSVESVEYIDVIIAIGLIVFIYFCIHRGW